MARATRATRLVLASLGVLVPLPAGAHASHAAVWEIVDPFTGASGAATLLADAGFDITPVNGTSFSESYAADLIVLGSFVSEDPTYTRVMRRHAERLASWVADGGTLVQLVQSARTEPRPPFLPAGLEARREDVAWNLLRAHGVTTPLLEGLVLDHPDGARFPLPGHPLGIASQQTFTDHRGWAVHLWSDPQIPYHEAALLEAAHGRGRILLVAIPLDKLMGSDGALVVEDPFPLAAATFFGNLASYVTRLARGSLPTPTPTVPRPPPEFGWTEGSWSVVVLPDTQFASSDRPEVLEAQIAWVVDSVSARDIRFVVHEGDVTHTADRREWRRARRAIDRLTGVVPFAVTTGNHDYRHGHDLAERRTDFADFFGVDVVRAQPTFGGVLSESRPENQYHMVSAGGRDWLVLTLEYLPSADAVSWADEVLVRHVDREAILVTHSYLDELDERIDLDRRLAALGYPPLPADLYDGQDLWRELVSHHPQIRFVLCGHVTGDGAGRRTDVVGGRPVHQILANYQMRRDGGEGWLRVLEFLPDRHTVRVHTYSPWLDRFMTDPQHQFELDLESSTDLSR
jgi:3',5'-cyclic AMP phosphodiesterase CpdA